MVNHGVMHYNFGSMENLFVRVLERFTRRLIDRQGAMYAADVPFLAKWRQAMSISTRTSRADTRRSGSSCRRLRGTDRTSGFKSRL